MLSHNESHNKLTLFTLAVLLSSFEIFLPKIPIFPWLKLGLANIVTLLWLYRYGLKDTLLFSFLRLLVTSLFFGLNVFTLTLGLSGAILSIVVMGTLYRFSIFGVLGVAVVGALFHNLGQILAVQLLLGRVFPLSFHLPIMAVVSIFTGAITGFGAFYLSTNSFLKNNTQEQKIPKPLSEINFVDKALSLTLLPLLLSLILLKSQIFLLIILLILLFVISLISKKRFFVAIKMIKRFSFFLIVLFITLLWQNWSRGIDIAFTQSSIQLLKMIIWISSTQLLQFFKTDILLFYSVKKLFKNREETVDVALLFIELFPRIIERTVKKDRIKKGLKNPIKLLEETILEVSDIIE